MTSEVVGEAVLRIRTDDSDAPDGQRLGRQTGDGYRRGFAGSLKGLAAIAAGALAVDKIVGFTTAAISGASDLQETIAKTGVIFGPAQDAVVEFASQGAKALGQTKQQALDAASTFGVFGKAAGLSGKDLAAFSTDFTGLATDLASFHNSSPQEAIDALGAALRGEAEPIRRFGVLLDDASLRAEALKQGLISTTKEALTPQQKTLAAQALIMKQTADAQGDFERTSGGLANQQRILSATVSDLTTKFGSLLLPIVTKVVQFINNSVLPGVEKLGPAFGKIGGFISDAFQGPALSGALDSVQQFIRGIQLAFDVMASGDDVAAGLGETLDFALGNTGELGIPIQNAVIRINDALTTLTETVQTIAPLIIDVFVNQIVPGVEALAVVLATRLIPVFVQVAGFIATQVIPTLAAIVTFIYGQVVPAVLAIVAEVATRLQPAFDSLVEFVQTSVIPNVAKLVEVFRTQLLPVLEPIVLAVIRVTGFLLKMAASIISFVLPPLLKVVGFILSKVIPAVVLWITWIAKVIGWLVKIGTATVQTGQMIARFGATITRLVGGALASLVSAVAAIPGKLRGLGSAFLSAGSFIIGQFVDGLKNAGGLVSDIAGNVWNALKGLINSAIDRINAALSFTISLPGPDVNINAPNIGHLAAGTKDWRGGWSWVGEHGPELLNLPAGAQVSTAAQSKQMAGGQIDYTALAAALAVALAPFLNRPQVTVALPTGDPEAAAQAVVNRLVAL